MPILNGTHNVTTSPTVVPGTGAYQARTALEVTIDNSSASEVTVGDSDVATTTGIRIVAGAKEKFTIRGDDELYIVAGSAVTVRYMVAPRYLS